MTANAVLPTSPPPLSPPFPHHIPTMGSLPNLNQLGKDNQETVASIIYRPGPALGHLCGGIDSTLSEEEKSKILHRYSGHNRIQRARSNGHEHKIIYDDFMLEHMAAYSPISSRSTRNLASQSVRRRDSPTSSIGATSVRRLLAVVRSSGGNHSNVGNTGHHIGHISRLGTGGTTYSRRILLANLLVLSLSHFIITATYLPFLTLQASVSVWTLPNHYRFYYSHPITINIGSLLLAFINIVAAFSALLGPALIQKLGSNVVFIVCYLIFVIFYVSHLYPSLYLLIPISAVLGLALGPLASARITFLMTLASKILYLWGEEDEDSKLLRRTCIIRRLARAFQAAHDFGLILGSILTAILVSYTINVGNSAEPLNGNVTDINATYTDVCYYYNNTANCSNTNLVVPTTTNTYDYNAFLDDIFDTFEGNRLCGAQACPPNLHLRSFNNTANDEDDFIHIVPKKTGIILACVYASLSLMAAVLSALGLDRIRTYVYQDPLERPEGFTALRAVRESFRDVRLQMAAPLALFIGFEQAFMFADFGKSYVVCTLGINRLNLVFLSMGILQSIAACTLSMLLRSIRRYYVVAVGFTFHACLLMVLILWKPIEDDPALFYVISAAWGVCNAIWEMLNFTLLTGLYTDNWQSAFANSTFFRFLGLTIAFVSHGLLCNYQKLYALGFFLLAAVIPFAWLEIRLENMRKVKNITRL